MNEQQVEACFYTCSLRHLLENGSHCDPNFFKNIWLEKYTFALLTDT